VEDWNNADVPGVFVTRDGRPPIFFPKQRAGTFCGNQFAGGLAGGKRIAVADLNNDLRADLVVAGEREITIILAA